MVSARTPLGIRLPGVTASMGRPASREALASRARSFMRSRMPSTTRSRADSTAAAGGCIPAARGIPRPPGTTTLPARSRNCDVPVSAWMNPRPASLPIQNPPSASGQAAKMRMGSNSGERGLRAVGSVFHRGASAWRTATRRSVAASNHSPEPDRNRQAEVSRVSGVGGVASSRKKVRSSGDNLNKVPWSPNAKNPRRVSATAGGWGLVIP